MRMPRQLLYLASLVPAATFVYTSPAPPVHADNDRILRPKRILPALSEARSILLDVHLPPDSNTIEPNSVIEASKRQLEDVGFTVTTADDDLHDVQVRIDCHAAHESRHTEEHRRPRAAETHSARFSGPPCEVRNLVDRQPMEWQRVDLVVYTMGIQAAKRARA